MVCVIVCVGCVVYWLRRFILCLVKLSDFGCCLMFEDCCICIFRLGLRVA